jgi:hypothetical protein
LTESHPGNGGYHVIRTLNISCCYSAFDQNSALPPPLLLLLLLLHRRSSLVRGNDKSLHLIDHKT